MSDQSQSQSQSQSSSSDQPPSLLSSHVKVCLFPFHSSHLVPPVAPEPPKSRLLPSPPLPSPLPNSATDPLSSTTQQYAQGALSSTLSSDPSSGEQTKAAAVEEMKAASAARHSESGPAQSGVLGTVEQKAGEIAGCEGMVGEGAERKGE